MFRKFLEFEIENIGDVTIDEINRMVEEETGIAEWFKDKDDIQNQEIEGFVQIDGNTLTIYEDVN